MLETRRLVLRKWQNKDVSDLYSIMKNFSVLMGGWKPHSDIKDSTDVLYEYIESDGRWAIELKDNKKVIGCVTIYPDNNRGKYNAKLINYVLSDEYGGNGYMTETIKRIIKYAFEELNIDLLSAFYYSDNIRSKKVLEKCGFEYEMTIEKGYKRFDGEVFDAVIYSIMKTDYCNK